MSADIAQPTRQAVAARDRSLPGKVTGRLRRAVDAMVWQAASRKEAAEMAGMTDHSLRQAMKRPHVMQYYLSECEVLRLSGRAKRLHRLEEIAASDQNMNAAVAAIKAAEQIVDERHAAGPHAVTQPGLVIVVTTKDAPPPFGPSIDTQPLRPIERVPPTDDDRELVAGPLPTFRPPQAR
jgi:hypothetical protein